ncbi:MAG: phage tail tip lysozyme [Stellaceae bacterium]
MPQSAYAPLPPSNTAAIPPNDGATPLDLAAGTYRPPAPSVSLATPSLAAPFATPLDHAAASRPPSAGAAPPVPVNPRALAINFFMTKGLTQPQATGIVDDMRRHESNLIPAAYNPAGGGMGAYGIGQWRGPRLRALLGTPGHNSLMGQLNFAWRELQGPEQGTLIALQKAKTPEEAANIWQNFYERPGPEAQTVNPATGAMMEAGQRAAHEYHDVLRGDIAEATRDMREYNRRAMSAPPGSAEADRLLQQQFEASTRAADALDKLAKNPPVFTPQSVLQRFGSLATVIAIFGGLMSKQPITAALGAAGTAMKAANQQNWDQVPRRVSHLAGADQSRGAIDPRALCRDQ